MSPRDLNELKEELVANELAINLLSKRSHRIREILAGEVSTSANIKNTEFMQKVALKIARRNSKVQGMKNPAV
jgi:hypothetical protein